MAVKAGEVYIELFGKDVNLTKVIGGASTSLGNLGKQMEKTGKQMTAKVTAPLIALGGVAVKSFGDFQKSGNKLATIADESVISMANMEKGALNLSNEMGVAATEINESLYQAISATGDTENALGLVEVAAKAAKGGFTDTATAIDGLTTVMNAYGLTGVEAIGNVSDQMLMAQNFGKTTFGEISSSIGGVIPIAAALSVGTDELFASIATLTKNGIQTSKAVTGMKSALSNIVKPTKEASDMAEKLGLNFSAAHLENVGFAAFLDEIGEATGGDTEKMAELFGSVEALNSMMVLAGSGAEDFDAAMLAMGDSAGSTDEAFNTMNQGVNDSSADLIVQAQNLAISFGEILAPSIGKVMDKASELLTWFDALSDGEKEQVVQVGAVAAAIGPLLMIGGKLAGGLSTIFSVGSALIGTLGSGGLSGVLAALGGPITLVVVAIAALVAIFAVLWNTNEEFRDQMLELWEGIKVSLSEIWEGLVIIGMAIFNDLKLFWDEWGATIMGVFQFIFTAIGIALKVSLDLIVGVFKVFAALFSGDWEAVWEAVKETGGRVWDSIGDAMMTSFNFLKDGALGIWQGIKDGILGYVNNIIEAINGMITSLNGVSFSVPDWVPGKMGGKSFGFDIPHIPMLAEGGIVNKATLAMIGEGAESEVVAPLSKLKSMMGEGSGVSVGQIVIHASGNAQQIARDIRRELSFELKKVVRV